MEQALLLLGIDARAAVMHFKAQPALFFQADGQADVATFGELDGVAEQVQQDLAHPHLVATDRDRPGRVLAAPEFQLALLRHRLHQALHLVEQFAEVKRAQVQFQPPGFDAGQVQRIIDQPQQVAAGLLDRAGIAALYRVQRVASSSSLMPSTPVIGVRTSWPSVARKRLLACEACSASCCLCTVNCHCWRRRSRARIDQTRITSSNDPSRM